MNYIIYCKNNRDIKKPSNIFSYIQDVTKNFLDVKCYDLFNNFVNVLYCR